MEISIHSNDFINYFNENNIKEYPKTKSGKPDMRHQVNRKIIIEIKKELCLKKNRENNIIKEDKVNNYRNEILEMNDKELNEFIEVNHSCIICDESMKDNHCKLKCGHTFCVDCFAKHSRVNHTCPMCRNEYCEPVKKIEKISADLAQGIIDYETYALKTYEFMNEDNGDTHTFYDSINNEIDDFALVILRTKNGEFNDEMYRMYKRYMKNTLHDNIMKLSQNITAKLMHYYNEQI